MAVTYKHMSEYNLTLTIRNGLLLAKMRQAGLSTAAELSRASGVGQSDIGDYLRLLESPYHSQTGELKRSAEKLCDYFGCIIDELFPAGHLLAPLKSNRYEADITADQIALINGRREPRLLEDLADEDDEYGNRFEALFDVAGLNAKERTVISLRFVEDQTFDQIGATVGVTRERIRQIERGALRKMRQSGGEIGQKWRGEKHEL